MDHSLSCNCLRLTFSASHFLRTTPQLGTRSPTANLDTTLCLLTPALELGRERLHPGHPPTSPSPAAHSHPGSSYKQQPLVGTQQDHDDTEIQWTLNAFLYQPAHANTFIKHLLLINFFMGIVSLWEWPGGRWANETHCFVCVYCWMPHQWDGSFERTISWKKDASDCERLADQPLLASEQYNITVKVIVDLQIVKCHHIIISPC